MKLGNTFFLLLVSCLYASAQTDIPDTLQKRNTVSLLLFQFTENGIGFGASYERALNHKGNIAFYIPVMITFDVANSNRIYDYNTGNYNTGKADALCYTMPGIKYYPFGMRGKVKYATGGSLVIGAGQKSHYFADINGLNETEQVQSHFIAGLMWQNSVSMDINKHLSIGMDGGIGSSILNDVGGTSESTELLIQGSLKVGYRY